MKKTNIAVICIVLLQLARMRTAIWLHMTEPLDENMLFIKLDDSHKYSTKTVQLLLKERFIHEHNEQATYATPSKTRPTANTMKTYEK